MDLQLGRTNVEAGQAAGRAGILLVCLFMGALSAQPVRINEIQSANNSTLTDDSGGTPDWIELHNAGATGVDLHGFGLSDDPGTPFKWTFTNTFLGPGEHLVAYASGLNRQPGSYSALAPTQVPGLKVWLLAEAINASDPAQVRASGGGFFLRQWRDQGPAVLHANQEGELYQPRYLASAPEFAGRPVVRFDGVDDLLRLPVIPAANSFCLVAVLRAAVGHEMDTASSGGVGGVSGQRYLFGAAHGGDLAAGAGLSVGTNGASVYEHGSGYMPALAVGGGVGTGISVVAVNYSNRQPVLWIRGNLASSGFVSARSQVTAPTEIGAGSYGAFSGDVAEILFFDRPLTEAEVGGLQQHLAAKYGLAFPRYYHTNFKLDKQGEEVVLTRANGLRADAFPAVPIPPDASWGRQPDGTGSCFYFEQPTPGRPNTTPGVTGFLDAPTFTVPAGFYTHAVTVGLETVNAGAEIRYTLNGSEPTTNSPRFVGPLTLDRRTGVPNDLSMIPTAGGWQPPLGEVFKCHVLRARAFGANALPSPTATAISGCQRSPVAIRTASRSARAIISR
jgi:hypothetical protein